MTKVSVCIIGDGRVGSAFVRALSDTSEFVLAGVVSRIEFEENKIPKADLYVLATPDGKISHVAQALSASGKVTKDTIVMHCSGALPASLLTDAGIAHSASFHPIKSFNRVEGDLANCTVCIEGEDGAVQQAFSLAIALRARPIRIEGRSKALYHASTVFSSNFIVALIATTVRQLEQTGFTNEDAQAVAIDLAYSALANIEKYGLKEGLTGPVARGDMATIQSHQEALKEHGEIRKIYDLLTAQLQSLVGKR